jgi:SAM-dependent methyltransferase
LHDVVPETQAGAAEGVRRFVDLAGDERVLVVGGGPLAAALKGRVGDVVEAEAELLTALPFARGEFDLAATAGTFHHVRRPELAVAELVRVTRLGGRILVADRIAPIDPLAAIELDRRERERDPAHTRLLPDTDMRALFEANGLVLLRSRVEGEIGWYLLRRGVT